jgi:hypothetical protein
LSFLLDIVLEAIRQKKEQKEEVKLFLFAYDIYIETLKTPPKTTGTNK